METLPERYPIVWTEGRWTHAVTVSRMRIQLDVDTEAGEDMARQASTEVFPFRRENPGGDFFGDVAAQTQSGNGELADSEGAVSELDGLPRRVFRQGQAAGLQDAGGEKKFARQSPRSK